MSMNRREFIQSSALGAGLLSGAFAQAAEPRNGIPYRKLGATGVEVSALCVGGAHLAMRHVEEAEAHAIMRTAVDEGVNFFDNAWAYAGGEAEIRMGKALKDGYRDKVFLMTKHRGRDAKLAQVQLEDSLKRLDVDVIDLWQFHEVIHPQYVDQIYNEGALEYALKARDEGKIKHIGYTGHHYPFIMRELLEKGFPFETVQMPLNPFDHHFRSFEQGLMPLALEKGLGVIAMKTNAGGGISKSGVFTPTECLRYVWSLPVSAACSGMDSVAVLRENLAAVKAFEPLSDDERKEWLARAAEPAAEGAHEVYKTGWHREIQEWMKEKGITEG